MTSKRLKCVEKLKKLEFCTLKCKLRSITQNKEVAMKLKEYVLMAHEAFKRASFFLRWFCLHRGAVPDMSVSTMRHCLNQVCTRAPSGQKVKDDNLGEEMRLFWDLKFSLYYPEKVDMCGKSMLKQLVAQQMLSNILVDAKSHFESRLRKVVRYLIERECPSCQGNVTSKSLWMTATNVSNAVMRRVRFRAHRGQGQAQVFDVEKCVKYDIMKNPGKYVGVTLKLCKLAKDKDKVCFMPTRRSNIPCHTKIDTECIAQCFISYAKRSAARKEAPSRSQYNDWVWDGIVKRRVVDKKFERSRFRFHHEITTDGISVSVLYSRPITKSSAPPKLNAEFAGDSNNIVPSSNVGLDPGGKNIVTMVDERGTHLRYTTPQRNFADQIQVGVTEGETEPRHRSRGKGPVSTVAQNK